MSSRALLIMPPAGEYSLDQFPLNLAYLAAALEAAGHEVRCLDMTAPYGPRQWSDVERTVAEFEPHFIGLTLYIDYIQSKYEFIRRLTRTFDRPLIVGGPHASCLPEETLSHGADVACIGEGEETIVEFAEAVAGRRSLDSINGLARRANGEIVLNPPRKPIADLDSLPFPAYDHFPVKNYAGRDDPNFNRLFWHMYTSRGCPFNCTYCVSRKVFDNRWRMRSPENLVDEIRHLVETYGVRYIAFQDDEPLISAKRMLRFCDLMIEADLGVQMSTRGRIDNARADVLARMKAAGFYFCAFGTESGDDETLRRINKKYAYQDIAHGLDRVAESGIKRINVSILCGFPWENEKHWANDIRMLRRIPPQLEFSVGLATIIPYPGTRIYEDYREEYGFTDWWLKSPPWQWGFPPGHVFFHHFVPQANIVGRYSHNFWSYTPKQKRRLIRLAWTADVISLKSRYDTRRLWVALVLSRLSFFLYRRWPRLEKVLFSWLTRPARLARLRRFLRGRKGPGEVY